MTIPLLPRLLIATEDHALARTFAWLLKENGYDISTASNVNQIHDHVQQEDFDLLVIDIGTASDGTLGHLTQIHQDPRYAEIPTLILADGDFDHKRLGPAGLSSADLIHRPYRVRDLLSRIKGHLRLGRELNRARAEARSRSELVAILKEITASLVPSEIYRILVRRVASGLRIARCSVVLATPGERRGTVVAAFENPNLENLSVDLEKYPEIFRALGAGETIMVSDVELDPLYNEVRSAWAPGVQSEPTRSVIAVPFRLYGELAGVFFLRTTENDPPLNQLDLGFAEQVIETAIPALEKAYDLERAVTGENHQRELADTDGLTGCANRRVLDQRLRDEFERAARSNHVLTVVILDIDEFKVINDTWGHAVGDDVLREIAALLRRELRSVDFLARYGGEEFVILLPETGTTGARIFMERILRRVQNHNFSTSGSSFPVTVSAGISTFPDSRAENDGALLRLADANLYQAKRDGRNRFRD